MPKRIVHIDSDANLGDTFSKAHDRGAKVYDWGWFAANRDIVHKLGAAGIDASDPVVKAVASLACLVALDSIGQLITNDSLKAVLQERARQDEKWGEQNHDPFTYQAILQEETGEAAKAALELRFDHSTLESIRMEHLREESVQVAAVALAIVECLDRGKWSWPVTQNEGG